MNEGRGPDIEPGRKPSGDAEAKQAAHEPDDDHKKKGVVKQDAGAAALQRLNLRDLTDPFGAE